MSTFPAAKDELEAFRQQSLQYDLIPVNTPPGSVELEPDMNQSQHAKTPQTTTLVDGVLYEVSEQDQTTREAEHERNRTEQSQGILPTVIDRSEDEYTISRVRSHHEAAHFWTSANLNRIVSNSKLAERSQDDLVESEDHYKWTTISFDEERDDRHHQLNMQRQDPNNQHYDLTEEEFKALKDDIRWDIAWKIFGQVNIGLDTDTEIDLNCLDIEEA